MNDLRFAVRQIRRAPGLAVAVVVTLALGIGATTGLFTVVNAVLLRPLPYPAPDRLVALYAAHPERGVTRGTLSLPDFRDWDDASETMSAMGLYTALPSGLVLQGEGRARALATVHVSPGFFPTLGVEPLLGRVFRRADETGDSRVVVVSHGFWRRELGGDSTAVGRTLMLSDRTFRVIGVMPPGFGFPSGDVEVWALLAIIPETSIPLELRVVRIMHAIGRLKPAVAPAAAESELSAIAGGLAETYPESNTTLTAATVVPLKEVLVGGVEQALLVMFGAVVFVLLIACVNTTNLLLVRGIVRERELAIRTAIGAGRGRIVRQLLAESVVLAVIGGAVGWLLAVWGVDVLLARSADVLPRSGDVAPDGRVLVFAIGASLLTVVVAGLYPALAIGRPNPAVRLREAAPGSGGGHRRGRGGLVAAEVAIALVLLVGAGLLTRSVWNLRNVDPGFEPEGALAVVMTLPHSRYPERADFLGVHQRLLERFRALPGVRSAGSIRYHPLSGGFESHFWEVPERPLPSAAERRSANLVQVTPDLFRALGIPLLKGREITEADVADAPLVAVISEALAREAFAGEAAVGRTLTLGGVDAQVVGVVGDVRHGSLDAPPDPTVYVALEQVPRRAMTFVLRTDGDPLGVAQAARDVVRAVDPGQAISELSTLDQIVHASTARPRFFAVLLAAFATLASSLAVVGIYGVLSFTVRQRTRELGIRAALGADRRRTLSFVLRRGMTPVGIGLAVGLVGASALSRVLERLLFGLEPLDVTTYVAVALLLATVALAACWIPGLRAARIDPMEALRHE